MGLESANYLFKCDKTKSKETVVAFIKKEFSFVKEKGNLLIYCSSDYWIDIQISEGPSKETTMSIRIALCNPLEGIERGFKRLLDVLFSLSEESVLLDLQSKETIDQLDDNSWDRLWSAYKEKRKRFEDIYGNLRLPVSSSLFYAYIDERG